MPNRKPLLGELLDYGNPFTKGLVGLWLMNEGSGNTVADLSGNGNTGTSTGTDWVAGKYGSAQSFILADSDIINLGTIPQFTFNSGDAFSVVSYFKFNSVGADWQAVFIKSYRIGHYDQRGIAFLVHPAGTQVMIHCGTESITVNKDFTTYHQIIATFDGSTLRVYFDGVFQNSVAVADDLSSGNARTAYIGRDDYPGHNFEGVVDYTYVYNRALIASEIAQLFREPFCMVRTRRRRVIFDEIAGVPPTSSPYYYREIASRRIA